MAKVNVRDRNNNKPGKKPNWEYRFEAAMVEGKRKCISKAGFRTKKEALEAGAKAMAEYNQSGMKFEPSEISVSDYLDHWFKQYAITNLKYSTQRNYENIIKRHLKPNFGFYKLKALNTSVIQDYVNKLKIEGFAKSSIVGILTTLSESLDYAIEPLHFLRENPARFVRMPKVERPKKERIILEPESWNTIISRFPYPSRFYIPLMIGYFCGLRIGETFGLTWDDINLETRELSVNKQAVKRKVQDEKKQSWYFGTPKTSSSKRTIKFGETLAAALETEKKRQEENEERYGGFYTIHIIAIEQDEKGFDIRRIVPIQKCVQTASQIIRLVCVDENGEYTSADSFKYAARVIHHELNIKFDYHSLRHTHATRLIENGANVKDVQARLGHENIETTLQTYVHDTAQMASDTVSIFEKLTTKEVKI